MPSCIEQVGSEPLKYRVNIRNVFGILYFLVIKKELLESVKTIKSTKYEKNTEYCCEYSLLSYDKKSFVNLPKPSRK